MQLTDADARLRHVICAAPFWKDLTRLGVAVSGGGDSVALLHLLAGCAPEHGVTLEAATVDHGLRPEAAHEAAFVAETSAVLGIPHQTLRWQGWDRKGNLQAEARAARYRLLAGWAQDRQLDAVALGHTSDDQAETFLMRLAREAGVDGLAAMDARFSRDGAVFWRPALALERGELRDFLIRQGLRWHDDPSNDDDSYDRVKARKALDTLAGLGIGRATLQGVATNLAAARRALAETARDRVERIAAVQAGDVVFERAGLLATQPEIRRRLIAAALRWVSGADYAPRREALADLETAMHEGRPHTLHGCLVTPDRDTIRIAREFNAVKDDVAPFGSLWDGRWLVTGPGAGLTIRALGDTVKDCPDWRETGLPRASLMASPAVWDAGRLVAAPLAGLTNGYSATINTMAGDFFTSVLSH
jgi:tRNA(Ile)-lysidine synthase